jgi:hypothetical protein
MLISKLLKKFIRKSEREKSEENVQFSRIVKLTEKMFYV